MTMRPWELSDMENELVDGALNAAVDLAESKNEQFRGLAQIIGGLCAIIHRRTAAIGEPEVKR